MLTNMNLLSVLRDSHKFMFMIKGFIILMALNLQKFTFSAFRNYYWTFIRTKAAVQKTVVLIQTNVEQQCHVVCQVGTSVLEERAAFETLVFSYQPTWKHIIVDCNLDFYCPENLRFHIYLNVSIQFLFILYTVSCQCFIQCNRLNLW